MDTFIVNGTGLIAGVPGQFSNCIVVRADDGTLTVTPLPNHPDRIVTPETEEPLDESPYEPATEEPPPLVDSPTVPLKPSEEGGE